MVYFPLTDYSKFYNSSNSLKIGGYYTPFLDPYSSTGGYSTASYRYRNNDSGYAIWILASQCPETDYDWINLLQNGFTIAFQKGNYGETDFATVSLPDVIYTVGMSVKRYQDESSSTRTYGWIWNDTDSGDSRGPIPFVVLIAVIAPMLYFILIRLTITRKLDKYPGTSLLPILYSIPWFIAYANGAGRAGANSGYEYANSLWPITVVACIGYIVNLIRKKTTGQTLPKIMAVIWMVVFSAMFQGNMFGMVWTMCFMPLVQIVDFKMNKVRKTQAALVSLASLAVWFLYMYTFAYPRNSSQLYIDYLEPTMWIGSIFNFVTFIFAAIQPAKGQEKITYNPLDNSINSLGQPQLPGQVQPVAAQQQPQQQYQQFQPATTGIQYPMTGNPQPIAFNGVQPQGKNPFSPE